MKDPVDISYYNAILDTHNNYVHFYDQLWLVKLY